MKKRLLHRLLLAARALGLFALARRVTRNDLRILCYHGAALDDEFLFRPGLFMQPATFATRMRLLQDRGYPVLPLGAALEALERDQLPPGATVVTIDDGWYGTVAAMAPVLASHRFPATFYVSTYYVQKQTQVFNVAVGYALWRKRSGPLELSRVAPALSGAYDLADAADRARAHAAILAYGDELPDAGARQQLLRDLCECLEVDPSAISHRRMLAFATEEELRGLGQLGVDVQLHTHRHRFPLDDQQQARREIDENRAALAGVTDSPLVHFCYPSGEYERAQWPVLEAAGIVSATTTRRGFARRRHHRYELPRFLDSERVTALEFEAEMSGLFELIRRLGYAI